MGSLGDIGVVFPQGFLASGVHTGVKREQKDLCLISSEDVAVCAAAYTVNSVKAAPVLVSMSNLKGKATGIIINSGNANALTGEEGLKNARKMVRTYAELLCVDEELVGVASTGVIGRPLQMGKVLPGIGVAFRDLNDTPQAGKDAAEAIMTTDSFIKHCEKEVELSQGTVKIGGMAKGSGMIYPEMSVHHATTLCFVTSDALIHEKVLGKMLGHGLERSFNSISVDGDQSTNDTCMVLANGASGVGPRTPKDLVKMQEGLTSILKSLAKMVAMDGEGAGKLITVHVDGASDFKTAKLIARRVATSNLVKSAMWGCDPNPGRIAAAVGSCSGKIDVNRMTVSLGHDGDTVKVIASGMVLESSIPKAREKISSKEVKIDISLEQGHGSAVVWGCDLTPKYVKINGKYAT